MSFAPSRLRPLYEQAMRLREAGYGPEADRLADQILRSPAQGGEDFHLQAHLLMQMGRFREAAARLDHALALDPATPERLADRAVALAETGRLAEAVASCEQALALRPDFVHAHFLHGDLLRELDRPDEALAA